MTVAITLTIVVALAILYAMLCTRYREKWCAREGFEDLGKVSDEWYQRLRELQDRFSAGEVGHVGSALRCVMDGRTLWLLEHEWRTGSINTRRALWKTFVVWELAESGRPAFTLRRKSPLVEQALATVVRAILFLPYLLFPMLVNASTMRVFASSGGSSDGKFTDEFARLYEVSGQPEDLRQAFPRDVQDVLCDQPLAGELVVTDRLLLWQAPGLLAPSNLDDKLRIAVQLRQLFVP